MVKEIQWGKWLLVFFLMSLFTFYQVPLSQYALGNTFNVINEQGTQSNSEITEKTNIEFGEKKNEDNEGPNEADEKRVETSEEITQITDETTEEVTIKKPVYLTIDDGPGINSKHILDVLERYEIQATFFLVEPRVRYC